MLKKRNKRLLERVAQAGASRNTLQGRDNMKIIVVVILLFLLSGCISDGTGRIPVDSAGIPTCYCEGYAGWVGAKGPGK